MVSVNGIQNHTVPVTRSAKPEVSESGDTAPHAIGKTAALLAKKHVDASEVPTT